MHSPNPLISLLMQQRQRVIPTCRCDVFSIRPRTICTNRQKAACFHSFFINRSRKKVARHKIFCNIQLVNSLQATALGRAWARNLESQSSERSVLRVGAIHGISCSFDVRGPNFGTGLRRAGPPAQPEDETEVVEYLTAHAACRSDKPIDKREPLPRRRELRRRPNANLNPRV